jgi:hypothetical protein
MKNGIVDITNLKAGEIDIQKVYAGIDLLWPTIQLNLYLGGAFTSYNINTSNRIISLNLDGSINTAFDIGTGFSNIVFHITKYIDKFYISGSFTTYNGTSANRIISLNLDGSINTTFNYGTGFSTNSRAILFNNDKIYIGGDFIAYKGIGANRIISLNLDGSINTAFDYGTGFNGTVFEDTIIKYNEKLYIGGNFTSYKGVTNNRIISLNLDGSINTAFNIGTGFNNLVLGFYIVDDILYVNGNFTSYNGITSNGLIGLNFDGSINRTFVFGGATVLIQGILKIQEKYIVWGEFSSYEGVSVTGNILLLNSDFTRDTSFNSGGSGFNGRTRKLGLFDNKLYIGGSFTTYNGTSANRIISLNLDGSRNTTFDIGTGLNDSVFALGIL